MKKSQVVIVFVGGAITTLSFDRTKDLHDVLENHLIRLDDGTYKALDDDGADLFVQSILINLVQ